MSEEPARVEGSSPARVGEAARQLIRRTRQVTRRKFPTEEKIRIVLEGIRGEVAVSELCRRGGIHPTIYYNWLKEHAWKACSREIVTWVRIPPSPPVLPARVGAWEDPKEIGALPSTSPSALFQTPSRTLAMPR